MARNVIPDYWAHAPGQIAERSDGSAEAVSFGGAQRRELGGGSARVDLRAVFRRLEPRSRGRTRGGGRVECALLALALSLVYALGTAAPAAAAARLSAAVPGWADAGSRLVVTGRLRDAPAKTTVRLQARVGGRWKERASAKVRKQRFTLRWRLPSKSTTVVLRVVTRVGKRKQLATRAKKVRIVIKKPTGKPVTPPPPSSGQPERPPVTQVLPNGAVRSVPPPGLGGELRLAGAAPVHPGDILASGIADNAPYGFLLRAHAVRQEAGDTVVSVSPATLLEAVPDADVDSEAGGGEYAVDEDLSESEEPARAAQESRITRRVSTVARCTNGATLRLGGSISLNLRPRFAAKWSLSKGLESASFEGRATATLGLEGTASGAVDCEIKSVQLARFNLSPVTIPAPVPIVVVPQVEVILGGNGKISTAVTAGAQGSVTLTAGQSWTKNEGFRPIFSHSKSFSVRRPTTTSSGQLHSYIRNGVTLALYGAGGPAFHFIPQAFFRASPDAWSLSAGLQADASLRVPALGLQGPTVNLVEGSGYGAPIAEWRRPPPPPPPPSSAPRLGGLDLSAYCRSRGSSRAVLEGADYGQNAVYGWRCQSRSGQLASIDINQACRQQYARPGAYSRADDVNDAYSWVCYG